MHVLYGQVPVSKNLHFKAFFSVRSVEGGDGLSSRSDRQRKSFQPVLIAIPETEGEDHSTIPGYW